VTGRAASRRAAGAGPGVRWALLAGNFVIGCGVMSAVGVLNDLTASLLVTVARGGQLIAIAAVVVCFGAPLLASMISGFDRRRLLAAALLWFGAGHALSALMPSYELLLPVRAATVLGAALFTPQAAAAIGHMTPPEQRGREITFIFIGWSVASIAGMPLAAWIGEVFGWRVAFGAIAALSLVAAFAVYAAMPDGVKPAALSRADWKAVFTSPVLMAMVLVTALSGAGQFTLFSYLAPYYKLNLHASAEQIGLLFFAFGVFGLIGNALVSRGIGRIGADRSVLITLVLIALSLLLWPLATGLWSMALVLIPWGLGCFSSNSAQQARIGLAAPAFASALMALNSSAIYLGQAAGASSGGWLIAHGGYGPLNWLGLGWLALAIALSIWAERRMAPRPA
jgi:predicted MFS family arabinose efflux permease